MPAEPLIFPALGSTRLLLEFSDEQLPVVRAVGPMPAVAAHEATAAARHRGSPLLIEHARGSYARPGLRGYRLVDGAGRDWSPAFRPVGQTVDGTRLVLDAVDDTAGLQLRTELEALPGGAVRARHVLTNTEAAPYVLEGLELTIPVPQRCNELLDFTGRHEHERTPQRHQMTDGLYLREVRRGRTSLESPTMLVAGTPGFGFSYGDVVGVHVAFSGNSVLRAERLPDQRADDRRRRAASAG